MRNYITEFIGTFFLMLVILMTGSPLPIGVTLMVMVYAGGHISGGHYNPAVTLAVLVRRKISGTEAIIYMVSQILGAIVAVFVAQLFLESEPQTMSFAGTETLPLLAELLGTFALAYVVLNTATAKGNTGNSFYGLAIGLTVFAMASAFANVSGAAFNPAVAIGACVFKSFAWENIWIYLVGCFAGGLLAGLVFNFLNKEDKPVPPIAKA